MKSAWALTAALLFSAPAQANGRLPMAGQIVTRAGEPPTVLLRTTFGILLSRDGGELWDYVCEAAMHYSGAQDPPYAFTAEGDIALVSSLGFVRGQGLQFLPTVPLRGARDLAIDVAANRTWVLNSQFAEERDGGAYAFRSSLLRDDAHARAIASAAPEPLPDDVLFETIDNLPGDASKVVLSAASHDARRNNQGYLLVSDDGGGHWHRLPVPLEARENSLYIAAIEAQSGQVVVRTYATPNSPSRLLSARFDDLLAAAKQGAAAPLRELLRHPSALFGVALAADGSVFAGGDGIYRAASLDAPFARVSPLRVRCLAASAGRLWACADEASGFLAGVSDDGGKSFVPKVRLSTVRAMAAGTESVCAAEWQRLGAEYGVGAQTPPVTTNEERRAVSPRWWWGGGTALVLALLSGYALRRRSRRSRAAR